MEKIAVSRLMDVNEVARALSVSVQSVRRWAKEQRLPSLKLGTRVLFNPADVTRFVENARRGNGETGDQMLPTAPSAGSQFLHGYIHNDSEMLLLPSCYVCGEPITDFEHANIVGPKLNEHSFTAPVRNVNGLRLQRVEGEILAVHLECDNERRTPWRRMSRVLQEDQRPDTGLGAQDAE